MSVVRPYGICPIYETQLTRYAQYLAIIEHLNLDQAAFSSTDEITSKSMCGEGM
jgi:hypothetical protein